MLRAESWRERARCNTFKGLGFNELLLVSHLYFTKNLKKSHFLKENNMEDRKFYNF